MGKMKGFRIAKTGRSGERYIRIKNNEYVVIIKRKQCGSFKRLSDAIERRNFILEYVYGYN